MSQQFFGSVKDKAQIVMTWLLTLANGQQYILVPVDGYDTVMEAPEEGDIWTGKLYGGGMIEVPSSQVFRVERDRYRVTVDNGQGRKGFDLNERELNQALDRAPRNEETGEVKTTFKSIHDRKTGERTELD